MCKSVRGGQSAWTCRRKDVLRQEILIIGVRCPSHSQDLVESVRDDQPGGQFLLPGSPSLLISPAVAHTAKFPEGGCHAHSCSRSRWRASASTRAHRPLQGKESRHAAMGTSHPSGLQFSAL